jgi:hypothetical protein
MILGAEVGVHRHRNLRLSGGKRWKNGMLMLKRGLALLLVVEKIGKRQRGLGRSKILRGSGLRTTTGITSDWFVARL